MRDASDTLFQLMPSAASNCLIAPQRRPDHQRAHPFRSTPMNHLIADSRPLFAGRGFRVDYDGLSAHNIYAEDGQSVRYAIVAGPYAGASGESPCQWRRIGEGVYAISWQEANGATVVHIDDFAGGQSMAFFTASDLSFHRMQGPLSELDAAQVVA